MSTTKSKTNVIIHSEELIDLSKKIGSITSIIEKEGYSSFAFIHENPFYLDGRCKDKVERIMAVSTRSTDAFEESVEPDIYGKIQMLSFYYSMLDSFCLNTLKIYKSIDEKAAEYLKELNLAAEGIENE